MRLLSKARMVIAAVAGGIALAAGSAHAAPIPAEGLTVAELVTWLQSAGLQTTVNTEHNFIVASFSGQKIVVAPSDCENGRCRSIQYLYALRFQNGLRADAASAAMVMNAWNTNYRWVKGFADEDRDPALEMDFSLAPGVDTEALNKSLVIFLGGIEVFHQFLSQTK